MRDALLSAFFLAASLAAAPTPTTRSWGATSAASMLEDVIPLARHRRLASVDAAP